MTLERDFDQRLLEKGISRRDFMKYCGFLTATMGLASSFVPRVAEVFAAPKQRPPVIWLHFAECTGCSEAVLRSMYPWIDELVLEVLSIEYHETIMAAAGHQAEDNLRMATKKYEGEFICVVEGAISTKDNGVYGKIGGRTFLEIADDVCRKAKAVIALGTCAAYGGVQAAKPNPGGYKGVGDALGISVVNIPGCPPNPINLVGTIANYLLLGKLPAVDDIGRPLFAYGTSIHDQCPRRSHYEHDEFVEEFGSEEAKQGFCLYKMGCKGPDTYNNCPIAKFNDGTSWPVEAGHPCIGCSEPDFWDKMSPFFEASE
ncbi:MAG: hydrogenase small subunit [Deltaproteobacteria bacterium]|nr:hydrogenase small subunit [Deltaproteobacteria bacterium]MBW1949416.1 hydrogenase small subunit [Deltaproteobacteria bacterium]MBW2348027.1 hydrogenase small subunit [Deltaproteobacteria bacterium]RLB40395.1 MAG: oxidoreductase [Deltaproteobacteria bacterium]